MDCHGYATLPGAWCHHITLDDPVYAQVVGRSVQDRATFFYSLYDKDGSGSVSRAEILEAVTSTQPTNLDPEESQKRTLKIMAHFDSDGDNEVSLQEFTVCLSIERAR